MSAPTPDSLQGPGFFGQLGNFFSGRPNEQRGRPQMINGEWRVPKYDQNNQFTGYGTLDPQLDARWNPGKLEADRQADKEKAARDELKGLALDERRHGRSIQDRQLRNAETQTSNSYQLQLADIKRQIEASNNQYGLLGQQIKQQGEAAKDSHALALATLEKTDATSNRALDLKGIEMQANIALQQDEMALKREQLNDLRGSRKLAFIGQAMQALLA